MSFSFIDDMILDLEEIVREEYGDNLPEDKKQ